jgi:hypothetical protein
LITTPVALRPLSGFPGWHTFSSGSLAHPWSTRIDASALGRVVDQFSGAEHLQPPLSAISTTTTNPGTPGLPATIPVITVPGPPGSAPSGPSWSASGDDLPAAADRAAVSVALADPELQSILASHPGWVERVASWGNCRGAQIGKVVAFRFAQPANFVATLPQLGKAAGAASYSTTVQKIAGTGWSELTALVDTTSNTVAGVRPMGYPLLGQPLSIGTQTVLATVSGPHDGGPPDDPSRCPTGD